MRFWLGCYAALLATIWLVVAGTRFSDPLIAVAVLFAALVTLGLALWLYTKARFHDRGSRYHKP